MYICKGSPPHNEQKRKYRLNQVESGGSKGFDGFLFMITLEDIEEVFEIADLSDEECEELDQDDKDLENRKEVPIFAEDKESNNLTV